MSIKFHKQPDGSFIRSGDLPIGTRTVRVYIDGVPAQLTHPAKEHVEVITDLIARGPCPAREYEIREVDVMPAKLIEQRTAHLIKARAARKKKEEE